MKDNIVGLTNIKNLLAETIDKKELFNKCNRNPNHMVFFGLAQANGRTMVANLVTDIFYENKLRKFTSLDYLLEFTTNGKSDNIEHILEDIETSAIYTSKFEGIVAINMDGLTDHPNDAHVSMFLEELEQIGEYSTLLFFIDSSKRNAQILLDKIVDTLKTVDVINVDAYTASELVEITKNMIEGYNIKITDNIDEIILDFIVNKNIETAKSCNYLAKELVCFANCNSLTLSAKDFQKQKSI